LIDYSTDTNIPQECLTYDIAERKVLFTNLQNFCNKIGKFPSNKMSDLIKNSLQNQIADCPCHIKLDENYSLLQVRQNIK
jgi:hypothetical protein